MSEKMRGSLYVMLGALFWSLAGLGIKYVPWHPLSISCVRGVVAAITIGCIRRQWKPTFSKATVCAALCMFATTVLFMFANKLTSAANAIVLQYTSPIYVLVASALASKNRLRLIDILTVIFTLLGVVLFFLDHLGDGAILGDVLALLSGATFAGVFFFTSKPSANPQDASFMGCMLAGVLFPMLLVDKQVVTGGIMPWVVIIALGVVQLGLGYLFFAKGVQRTGAVTSVIISAAEPILNPLWVFLALGETPGALSIVGGAIVIITICAYNVVSARKVA